MKIGSSNRGIQEAKEDDFFLGIRDPTIPSMMQPGFTSLRRRDSNFSAATDYRYASPNDLTFWQGAALLTADCMGTGVLALPGSISVLGWGFGLSFLVLNGPINLYAGTILSNAAAYVERKQKAENEQFKSLTGIDEDHVSEQTEVFAPDRGERSYDAIAGDDDDGDDLLDPDQTGNHHSLHHDTATFDFIGMTAALFRNPLYARVVMVLFYTNIFLVLGDYILVMAHAVAALLGEDWLCIPQAGLIAATLMFVVSQLRTMANLGRTVSLVSLSALLVVIMQCIYFAQYDGAPHDEGNVRRYLSAGSNSNFSIFRKLSSMGSIGFAMGSQKLFLNIRHELADREAAPKSLAVSLTIFASFYVLVVVFSGSSKDVMCVLASAGIFAMLLYDACSLLLKRSTQLSLRCSSIGFGQTNSRIFLMDSCRGLLCNQFPGHLCIHGPHFLSQVGSGQRP